MSERANKEGAKTNVDVLLEPCDTIIMIVGMAGVGKSSFINKAVGKPAITINDDLNSSGNQTIQPVISSHPNDSTRRLVFLDTPGFNDTLLGDEQILKTIADWLKAVSCEKEATLGGIIYLYDISQARPKPIDGSLAMFYRPEEAKEAMNVVLATTKWAVPVTKKHTDREAKLHSNAKLWTGPRFRDRRFLNTRESAWEIVELLLKEKPLHNTQFRRASDMLVQSVAKRMQDIPRGTPVRASANGNLGPKSKALKRNGVKDINDLVLVPGARITDVIIPIMGPTGVGKSTFINVAAGKEVTPVGNVLESCTSTILPVIVPHPNEPGRRIIFVDTPGFDDTYLDDTEVLRRIAVWMAFAYDENTKPAGIIYLHEISQTRMFGASHKNFVMFNRLTGLKAAKSLVLVTTKWDEVPEDVGNRREYQLSTTHWHKMLQQGSHMRRFENTQQSAWDIVNVILGLGEIEALQIQEELVDLQKRIPTTEAGSALRNSLQELLKEQKELAGRLKKESVENEHLRERYQEVERQLRSTVEQIKDLKVPLGRRIMAVFSP